MISSEPLYFGPRARPRFGWLHRPQSGSPSLGLVVCNPFGYEAICAHRSLRHVADAAAAAGVPALRFDYDGTGDSTGSDRDPDRVASWIASIHDAVETLRRRTGVARVCLFGVRLGALLAARAAVERSDVAAFVALAPVVSGRVHVRELRALQMSLGLVDPPPGRAAPDGEQEAVGFRITKETREALSKIDLAAAGVVPARHVLIVDRDDLPVAEAWAERLRGSGACVDLRRLAGYTEMVLDPHKAKVPEQIIAAVTGWLGEISATAATVAPATEARTTGDVDWAEGPTGRIATDGGATVVETAAYLDPAGTTFGILAAPDRAPRASAAAIESGTLKGFPNPPAMVRGEQSSPAPHATKGIVLLNAGAIHHVGPNRLYVNFARRWAAMGHVVLRIDVSGIGDSPPRRGEPENVVYTARAMEDVSAALAHLRQQGIATTYVMGLCSGAYNAVRAAAAGQSIDGVVPINPLTFFWKDGMSLDYPSHRVVADARRYSNSIRSLDAWKKVLRGQVKLGPVAQVALRDAAGRAVRHVRDAARAVGFPFAEDLGADLGNIAKRGARIRFVFAADDPGAELLRVQGGSEVGRLRRKGALTTDVIYGPDHTFTPVWSHDVLGDCLTSIVERET